MPGLQREHVERILLEQMIEQGLGGRDVIGERGADYGDVEPLSGICRQARRACVCPARESHADHLTVAQMPVGAQHVRQRKVRRLTQGLLQVPVRAAMPAEVCAECPLERISGAVGGARDGVAAMVGQSHLSSW
jgi:hypothetical protein